MALCSGHILFIDFMYIMRQNVVYIIDLCLTLTFDLYVGDEGILSEF